MASIDTVNDLTPRVQYVASAAQTDFVYPFPIFEDANLTVVVDGVTKALDTDYTVAGAESDTGGTITFLVAMAGNEIVTIYRDLAIERLTDFQQNGTFASASFNNELDRITLVQQELAMKGDRALRVPLTAEVDSDDIELTVANFANKYLTFDADGKPTPAVLADATMTQAIIGGLYRPRSAAEIAASVTPTNYYWDYGYVQRYGAAVDGVTDDYAALNSAVALSATYPVAPWAGTLLLSTDTVITIPTGGTIGGKGPKSVISKTSGSADIFTTTGNDIRVRGLRLLGPNNTTVDGITTDGGSDILIEDIEGYQLASTVTIGLTTETSRVTIRSVYSDDNAQQGVHLNKCSNFHVSDIRSSNTGTTNLHHGLYVGNCSYGVIVAPKCWDNAGFGVHVYAQSSYAMRRVVVVAPVCWGNGTYGSGVRGGVFVGRDSTSSCKGVSLIAPATYDNESTGLYVLNGDDVTIVAPDEDGNADATANGFYVESGSGSAATTNVRIIGGRSIEHSSNVRVVAPASTTVNVWLDGVRLADADAGGAAGVFANGAGTQNVYCSPSVVFSNNTADRTHSGSAGGIYLHGTAVGASSYTGSLSGCTTVPTGSIEYSVNGDQVTLEIPAISATSNTTACTITGMPAAIRPAAAQTVVGITTDNGATAFGKIIVETSGTLTLHVAQSATFTGSGTKGVAACSVCYRLT